MESTYPHYQGPASLPADYALLHRYAQAQNEDSNEPNTESNESDDDLTYTEERPRLGRRRSSFPTASALASKRSRQKLLTASYMNNLTAHPGMVSNQQPNENTYLLGTSLVHGPLEEDELGSQDKWTAFWEEFRTLFKYTLPVFGSVLNLPPTHLARSFRFAELICWNTVSSLCPP
jgi:multidrug resistance protein, MATE family